MKSLNMLKSICFLLVLGCGTTSVVDGFGAETTNGTVSMALFLPEVTDEIQFEVTLIPQNFISINSSELDLLRDTTDVNGVLDINGIAHDEYNIIAKPLSNIYSERLFIGGVTVENEIPVLLNDTLRSTGSVELRYSASEDNGKATLYLVGTEISKNIKNYMVDAGAYHTITLDSLPVGKLGQVFYWKGDITVPYASTDSIEVFSDSVVVIYAYNN